MNSQVQGKINAIKKMSADKKGSYSGSSGTKRACADGLSVAIHSQKDADTFMTELKAIRKKAK